MQDIKLVGVACISSMLKKHVDYIYVGSWTTNLKYAAQTLSPKG